MRPLRPSMMGLQAFEAAARRLSFTAAAEELCLTQGAVSRQIKLLEDMLGVTLFRRAHNRVILTDAGRMFLDEILEGLSRIDAAMLRVQPPRADQSRLNLAVGPAFGARWLMPRFPGFMHRHPEAVINVFSRVDPVDFSREDFDTAVHYGPELQEGLAGDWLIAEDPVPICSPRLDGIDALRDHPEKLPAYRLLHLTARSDGWHDWTAAAGLAFPGTSAGPKFEQLFVLIEAARAGLGVGLAPRYMVANEVAQGQLIVPFDQPIQSRWGYWLVYPPFMMQKAAFRSFRSWLLEECASYGSRMPLS